MKLLYFTDTHIRGTSPKSRNDDFVDTLVKKFHEISKIIEDENVDYILHGGDLFDRPDISISVAGKFARILNKIKKPIYLISGNHDVYGHNPKTINRTMIGLLNQLNIINIVNDKKIILEKNNVKTMLTGQPYLYNMDDPINKNRYMVKDIPEDIDFAIHLVHGMLLDKPFIKGVPYTLIDDIKDTDANITLSGHYHSGFNQVEIDGKYFINPGSIVRISNSISEINRKPKILIIDLTDKIKLSYIYLKTALDGKKILNRDEIERNIYKRERIYEFKQTIDAALNFEKMDINDVLIEVSNSQGVEEVVKREALNRIAQIQMKGLIGE